MAENLDIESLFHPSPRTKPETCDLLIAEPLMRDPWFGRSVVVLIDRTHDNGFMGLMLNKPTPIWLSDLCEGVVGEHDVPVYCGGPVDTDRLFMLHRIPEFIPGSIKIGEDLYVGGDVTAAISYINSGASVSGHIRFILGYSGWAPDQLESEILHNTWLVAPSPSKLSELLHDSGNAYWRREVQRCGDQFKPWLSVPPDPQLN